MSKDTPSPELIALAAKNIIDAEQREAYLEEACAGDQPLLSEVRELLQRGIEQIADSGFAATMAANGENVGPAAAGTFSTEAYQQTSTSDGGLIGGKYRLLRRIGEGGMGSVWSAEQREPVKRTVALKLIKSGMNSREVLARFDAERQALALMDHPNIARIYDGGITETGSPYFVMELVKGLPITDYCDQHRLTLEQRLLLFIPVCQAIQHAHHKGIIHRDIKPSNVLVATIDDKPVAKVIDFGVAKATGPALTEMDLDTGFAIVGTPQYMSPEQASMNQIDIDTRSDVYSLGVLLYELLAGSPPFKKEELAKAGYQEILRIIREEEPPRPSTKLSTADVLPSISAMRGTDPKRLTVLLRHDLDWIVMRALEKERSRRYETANAFAMDIRRYLHGEPVQAHPPSTAYRIQKFLRKNRGPVLASTLVAIALVLGIIGTTLGMVEAFRQAALARQQELFANKQTEIAERERTTAQQERNNAERQLKLAVQRLTSARQTISAVVNNIPNLLERVPLAGQAQRTILKQMDELLAETSEDSEADADFESSRSWGRMAVEYRLGRQAKIEGNREEAESHLFNALKIAQGVYEGTPRDRAKAASNLASVHLDVADLKSSSDPEEAFQLIQKSIQLYEEALAEEVAEDSAGKRLARVGVAWNRLAGLQLQAIQLQPPGPASVDADMATVNCQKAIDLLQKAIDDLKDNPSERATAVRDLSAAALNCVKVAKHFHDDAKVLDGYELAISNLKQLLEIQPERIYNHQALADVTAEFGDYLLIQKKDAAAARTQYVESMKLLRQLQSDPQLKQLHANREMAYYRLGLAADALGSPEQVKRYFERAVLLADISLRERSDEPAAKSNPRVLVSEKTMLMLVQAWAGQAEPAVRAAREIRTLFEGTPPNGDKKTAADALSRAAFALAIVAAKTTLSDTSRQIAQREALETFKSALMMGYNDVTYLASDPDVGPLKQIEGVNDLIQNLRTTK